MSALLLAVVAVALLVAGYFVYSPKVARWLGVDNDEQTPAVELNDGVDYVPAKHWMVLFGHHFASIAGAAPIIGPVVACLFWGWLPAAVWIVVGGILFGAVHDFTALTLSLKHKGQTIASLAESVLGRSSKIVFSIFVFLALILVVAIFASAAGLTLAKTPQVVMPTFGLIVVAVVVGFLMYRVRLNTAVCSVIGMLLLAALIYAGYKRPVSLPDSIQHPEKWWTVILLIYGLVASVTPVTLLLQPRDHLAASVLFVGMFLGFLGLIVTHPTINAPAYVEFEGAKGWLWPMLFVNIACGAVSGFHSLVASGTTSKQLSRMRDARLIGYGGMIMESALSILALVAVTAGLYWKSIPEGAEGYVYQDFFKPGGGGWLMAFGKGYGTLTDVFLRGLGVGLGTLVGITMLKTFIMTTLDSATRITRYIASELLGETFGVRLFKNKYAATILVGALAAPLALTNPKALWPIFGSANQLIAGLVFIVATVYLMVRGRNYLFTAIPAVLLLATTIAALIYKTHRFVGGKEGGGAVLRTVLAVIAVVLMVLAAFIVYQSFLAVKRVKGGKQVRREAS